MNERSRRMLRIAILIGGAAALAGCDSIREAAGNMKEPPDEFAITTKAPLTIPPDYNLRPPAPGATPTNQVEPSVAAQQALFASADPATAAAAMPGTMSQGEKLLLAYAGAQNSNPTVRQDIASDGRAMQSASDDFTRQALDWKKPDTPAADPTKPPDQNKPDTDKKKTSGGWFDWF